MSGKKELSPQEQRLSDLVFWMPSDVETRAPEKGAKPYRRPMPRRAPIASEAERRILKRRERSGL